MTLGFAALNDNVLIVASGWHKPIGLAIMWIGMIYAVYQCVEGFFKSKVKLNFQKKREELEAKASDFRAQLISGGQGNIKENPYEIQLEKQLTPEREKAAVEQLVEKWSWVSIVVGTDIFGGLALLLH